MSTTSSERQRSFHHQQLPTGAASILLGQLGSAALVAGECNPKVLAQLARRSMRKKITVLEEAFTSYFTDHRAFLPGKMLARVNAKGGPSGPSLRDRLRRPVTR